MINDDKIDKLADNIVSNTIEKISNTIDNMIIGVGADDSGAFAHLHTIKQEGLTYEKLKNLTDSMGRTPRLDDDWILPFGDKTKHKYYLSYPAYELLKTQIQKFISEKKNCEIFNLYDFQVPTATMSNLGIYVTPTAKIAADDFNFYYEDKDEKEKLHPVLVLKDKEYFSSEAIFDRFK